MARTKPKRRVDPLLEQKNVEFGALLKLLTSAQVDELAQMFGMSNMGQSAYDHPETLAETPRTWYSQLTYLQRYPQKGGVEMTNREKKRKAIEKLLENDVYLNGSGLINGLKNDLMTLSWATISNLQLILSIKYAEQIQKEKEED